MKFIGRSEELKKLNKMLAADGAQMALIYGRRRVGKSELVKQFLKDSGVKSIYYECRQIAEESNTQGISEVVSEALGLPELGYTSFERLLDFVFSQAEDEPIIFV
ncbi:MAG: ATP-binding protein, partial [Eubacterium sp.]